MPGKYIMLSFHAKWQQRYSSWLSRLILNSLLTGLKPSTWVLTEPLTCDGMVVYFAFIQTMPFKDSLVDKLWRCNQGKCILWWVSTTWTVELRKSDHLLGDVTMGSHPSYLTFSSSASMIKVKTEMVSLVSI